jgi:hypothetical protein
VARRSSGQGRLTPLQEAADRGIALETDRDLVCAAGFAVGALQLRDSQARLIATTGEPVSADSAS